MGRLEESNRFVSSIEDAELVEIDELDTELVAEAAVVDEVALVDEAALQGEVLVAEPV
jgi:hypothetical protein